MKNKHAPITPRPGKKAQEFKQRRIEQLRGNFIVVGQRMISDEEIVSLKAVVSASSDTALVAGMGDQSEIRRTDIHFVLPDKFQWLYDRVWALTSEINKMYRFNLTGIEEGIQLAIYDESDQGFYTWHEDSTIYHLERKISLSIPLSESDDYDGGELQFMIQGKGVPAQQSPGVPVVFPSFLTHRVTPVTRGRRYSLVSWITGPDWR